jgi:hypothetical protein
MDRKALGVAAGAPARESSRAGGRVALVHRCRHRSRLRRVAPAHRRRKQWAGVRFGGVWAMVVRTAYSALGFSPLRLVLCVVGMLLAYQAPWIVTAEAVHSGAPLAGALGVAAMLLMLLHRQGGERDRLDARHDGLHQERRLHHSLRRYELSCPRVRREQPVRRQGDLHRRRFLLTGAGRQEGNTSRWRPNAL